MSSMFDDIMAGAVVAKHVFRGASKAYAKAKKFAESEKGQQLKAELQAKTNEAIGLAGDKAREMGLEAKAKYVLEYAKGMILNNSAEIPPDVQAVVYGPGGYAERINALETRIVEETAKHNSILADLDREKAKAPEYIELDESGFIPEDRPLTISDYERKIDEEYARFSMLEHDLQDELLQLKAELEEGLFMARQQQMEEENLEKELRREENERDWAIFLGQDPNEYR